MILKTIESENFGPFRDKQSIELDENIYSIVCEYEGNANRSNRGGKTAFIEMFLYCLYGATRSRDKVNFIYRDSAFMYVSVKLVDDSGEEFLIERSCDRKGKESLVVTGADGSNKDVSQDLIEQKIGLGYKDFILSFYFKQQDISAFFDAKTTERKKVLSRWFEKEYWQSYYDNVEVDRTLVKDDIDAKRLKIDAIKGEDFDVDAFESKLNDAKLYNTNITNQYNEMFAKYQGLEKEFANKGNVLIFDEKIKNGNEAIERLAKETRDGDVESASNAVKLDQTKVMLKTANELQTLIDAKTAEKDKYDADIEDKYLTASKEFVRINSEIESGDYAVKIETGEKDIASKALLETERVVVCGERDEFAANDPEVKSKETYKTLVEIRATLALKQEVLGKIDKYGGVCPVTSNECPHAGSIETQRQALQADVSAYKVSEIEYLTAYNDWEANVVALKKVEANLVKIESDIAKISIDDAMLTKMREEFNSKSIELKEIHQKFLAVESDRNAFVALKNELIGLAVKNNAHDYENEIKGFEGKITTWNGRKKEIEGERSVVAVQLEQLNKDKQAVLENPEVLLVVEKMNEVTDELNSLRPSIDDSIKSMASLELLMSQHCDKLKQCEELVKEVEVLGKKFEELTFISFMFSGKGIPSIIIENSLVEIEDETNVILSKLGVNIQIEFQSERDLKSWEAACLACGTLFEKGERTHKCKSCGIERAKKKKDDLDIYVIEGDRRQLFELDSGGGKTLICFAFRNAIARMLQKMLNVSFNSIILDEILAPLDEANTIEIVNVIVTALTSQFGFQQVFMISHKDVKNYLNKTIKITRYSDADYSEYKLVS